jgi:hypothetical protein
LIAARIAGLNHEVGHDARHRLAIEVPLARETDEVINREQEIPVYVSARRRLAVKVAR